MKGLSRLRGNPHGRFSYDRDCQGGLKFFPSVFIWIIFDRILSSSMHCDLLMKG